MDKFKVGVPEWEGVNEDDYTVYDAIDAEDAAQDHVTSNDEDYDVVHGDPALVVVIDETGVRTTWRVHGEMVPEYWAEEL